MNFQKFSSIENVYRTKFLNQIIEQGKSSGEWVVTEKIHGCLTYDALVETDKYGKIPIGKIINEKLKCNVKSYNIEKDIIEFKPINGYSVKDDNGDWYKITFSNNEELLITGGHYVWLHELKCWRKVEDLSIDDIVLFSEN
jgi:hypothetical protein